MRRHEGGFTLLEAMIVLVIVGVVAAISLDMLTGAAKAEARRQMISQQAIEMATIDRAIQQWVVNGAGLPTVTGGIAEVSLQDVVGAGLLPGNFAQRPASGRTTPVSPLGIPYRAFIRRTTSGKFEVVTMPVGPANAGFAARAGISQQPEALRIFNVAVMQEVRSEHRTQSGVINAGQSTIDPASSGFSLNLLPFLGGAVNEVTVAALSNFAELQTEATPAPANPNEFLGKTCRATNSTCNTGEREASSYQTCRTWGLQRSQALPHTQVGEVFITPIGNIQITKLTNINTTSGVAGQINSLPAMNPFLTTNTPGLPTFIRRRDLFNGQGDYVGYAVECRHPNGTVWDCVPHSLHANLHAGNIHLSMAPTPAQFVSGSLAQSGPGLMENASSTELILELNHYATSNWRRTSQRSPCPGSTNAIPTLIWTQDFDVFQGSLGMNVFPDGHRTGPAGKFQVNSIGPTPAYTGAHMQSNPGPAARVTYSEITQIPGQSAITTICEENVLSNSAVVPNPRPSGWAGASIPSGTNACPTTNFVARIGGINYTLLTDRPFETIQFRPRDEEQPTIRICCQ